MSDRLLSDRRLSEEEFRNEVIHRRNLGESERRIARQLNVSRWLVTKVIRQNRKSRGLEGTDSPSSTQRANSPDTIPGSLGQPSQKRASQLDAFEPQLRQLLERYPRITVIRLQQELQDAGYKGGYSILAERVRELRERYTTLGEVAVEFLDGLLAKARYSKHHPQKILTLLNVYPKSDVLAAMQRAVMYRAFDYADLCHRLDIVDVLA